MSENHLDGSRSPGKVDQLEAGFGHCAGRSLADSALLGLPADVCVCRSNPYLGIIGPPGLHAERRLCRDGHHLPQGLRPARLRAARLPYRELQGQVRQGQADRRLLRLELLVRLEPGPGDLRHPGGRLPAWAVSGPGRDLHRVSARIDLRPGDLHRTVHRQLVRPQGWRHPGLRPGGHFPDTAGHPDRGAFCYRTRRDGQHHRQLVAGRLGLGHAPHPDSLRHLRDRPVECLRLGNGSHLRPRIQKPVQGCPQGAVCLRHHLLPLVCPGAGCSHRRARCRGCAWPSLSRP